MDRFGLVAIAALAVSAPAVAEVIDVTTIGTKRDGSAAQTCGRFVGVSPDAPRYFRQENGSCWLPIGCNIGWEWGYKTDDDRETCEKRFLSRMRTFAANGGNFMRIWLGHALVDSHGIGTGT